MPLCTLHLVQLADPSALRSFLALASTRHALIWAGKVFEPVVYDGDLDRRKLLGTEWTVGILVAAGVDLDGEVERQVKERYTVAAGALPTTQHHIA